MRIWQASHLTQYAPNKNLHLLNLLCSSLLQRTLGFSMLSVMQRRDIRGPLDLLLLLGPYQVPAHSFHFSITSTLASLTSCVDYFHHLPLMLLCLQSSSYFDCIQKDLGDLLSMLRKTLVI